HSLTGGGAAPRRGCAATTSSGVGSGRTARRARGSGSRSWSRYRRRGEPRTPGGRSRAGGPEDVVVDLLQQCGLAAEVEALHRVGAGDGGEACAQLVVGEERHQPFGQ